MNIVWLCDQDHLDHPFICIVAKTFIIPGHQLTIIDRARPRWNLPYLHLGVGFSRSKWRLGRREIWGSGRLKVWLGWPFMLLHLLRTKPEILIVDLPTTGRLAWM